MLKYFILYLFVRQFLYLLEILRKMKREMMKLLSFARVMPVADMATKSYSKGHSRIKEATDEETKLLILGLC